MALLRAAPAFAQVDGSGGADPAAVASGDRARAEFSEGLRHLRAEQWAEAEAAFRRSLELVPRASTRYNLALVLFKQRRARESLRAIDELLATPAATGDERYHAFGRTLRPLVISELGRLTLVVEPADAQLELDGEPTSSTGSPRSIWAEPGSHQIRISAPGFAPQSRSWRAERGQDEKQGCKLVALARVARAASRRARATEEPRPTAPPARSTPEPASLARVAPWVTIGAGSLLLAGGVAAWVRAKNADAEFTDACPTLTDCDPALEAKQDEVQRYARLGTALLAGGGVLVVGGVVWHIVMPATPAGNNTSRAWFVSARGRF